MSVSRPRGLFIAPTMPAVTGNGLAMRLGTFLEGLSRVCEVTLVVLPVAGAADAPPSLPSRLRIETCVIPVAGRHDTHFGMVMRLEDPAARRAAFRRYGRGTQAAHLSAMVLNDLRQALGDRRFAVAHIGRMALAETFSALAGATCRTLDLDEDEAASHLDMAKLLRAAGRVDAAEWAVCEAEAANRLLSRLTGRFPVLFVSSSADAAGIRRRHPDLAAEIIVNSAAIPVNAARRDDGATLLFIGSFGYAPNVDAVTWFARDAWPLVRGGAAGPVRLLIAGRGMTPAVSALAGIAGIEVLGAVDDLAGLYGRATLAIAPLRAGAGTRIKVIEAAAHHVPVVATSLAAQGLSMADGDCLWLADGADRFAGAVLEALSDPAERARRARRAATAAARTHDRETVVRRIASRFADMISP